MRRTPRGQRRGADGIQLVKCENNRCVAGIYPVAVVVVVEYGVKIALRVIMGTRCNGCSSVAHRAAVVVDTYDVFNLGVAG